MFNNQNNIQAAIVVIGFLLQALSSASAYELSPNPNPSGSSLFINTAGAVSTSDPFLNYGSVTIQAGGVFTNYFEFITVKDESFNSQTPTFTIELGGRLVNDKAHGIFTIDTVAQLLNQGTIDNNGTMKTSWSFYNSGLMNNYAGAGLTNTSAFSNTNVTVNSGNFINNYDPISHTVATMENSGTWTNKTGSTFTNYGTINSFGTLNNAGQLTNTIIGSGGSGQGTFDHYGTLNNTTGGIVDNQERWFSRAGSVINNSATFNNGGLGMRNEGTINNLAGGIFTNVKSLGNTGQINNAGTFIINAGAGVTDVTGVLGTYTQTAGLTTVNGSLIGSTISIQGGTLNGSGSITGPLSIGGSASLNPGSSPGTLTVNGNFSNAGLMLFEIAGLAPGQYDQLKINGSALITGGTLEFDFISGFSAAAGDSWTFLFADSYSGQNTLNYVFKGLAPGLTGNVVFDTGHWSLNVAAVPLPAAAWLFGSGLFCLFRVTRGRR